MSSTAAPLPLFGGSASTIRTPTVKPIPYAEKIAWIRLIGTENIGPITMTRLLERHGGNAAAVLEYLPEYAKRGGRSRALAVLSKGDAEKIYARAEALGQKIICKPDPEYPANLALLEDAPPILFVKGNIDLLHRQSLGVVGARNASLSGRQLAREWSASLGVENIIIVSGLAKGIDTACHEGSLKTGTVAVVAGGVDVLYPKENADLYDKIAESGAIISECFPNTQPQANHFPKRNRIIAGLCDAVLVVEATFKSGSLITATQALDYGREVLSVPGSPLDSRAEGTNQLIKDGCRMVVKASEVLEALSEIQHSNSNTRGVIKSANNRLSDGQKSACNSDIFTPQNTNKNLETVQGGQSEFPVKSLEDILDAPSIQDRILGLLSTIPVNTDTLIRETGISAPMVLTVLLEMELGGLIQRHSGNGVSLVAR